MPFAPGTPKPPNSGRKKGAGNRATVAAILAEMHCDPIRGMATIAENANNKTELRLRAYAELARYRWPQLKAIEHTGEGGGPVDLRIEYVDSDIPE